MLQPRLLFTHHWTKTVTAFTSHLELAENWLHLELTENNSRTASNWLPNQSQSQSQSYVTTHRGLTTVFLLLSDSCGFVDVGRSFWRENGSAVYNCCWASPAQSFLGPSPAGLMTIFYCLRFETPPNLEGQVPVFISPRNRVAQLYPQALGFCVGCLILPKSRYIASTPSAQTTPPLLLKRVYRIIA
jgi:hypothetical protein